MAKRRSQGDGSIRQRSDGRWEARLTLPNGRRISAYGKTQKEVRTKLRDMQKKLEAGLDLAGDKLTVANYLTDWLLDIKDSVRETTWRGYSSHVRTHLIPSLGRYKLSDLKAPHVNAMLRGMAELGLSGTTQKAVRTTLRKALNDAIDADLLSSNAAGKSRVPKNDTKQINPLTPQEVKTLLRHTREHWYGPLIHTAIGTGMRKGELLGLRWEDVDLEAALLRVEHSMQKVNGKPTLVSPKTDKSRRVIALDPTTVEALKRQQRHIEDARLVAGDRWQDWDLVFPSRLGTPLDGSNVTNQFQKLLSEAGLRHQRFHDLRHCSASLLLAHGASIKTIQDFLGHSQISLTANLYTHMTEEIQRDNAERMAAALMGSEIG